MAHRSVIPFGPQHPVLPEPLHLDLVIEDDRVIEAIPQIGFVHRGLEKLTEKRDMHQFGYIAERICGICAVGHSCGYASACERMLDIEVPGRVQYIRTILHELSRIHSHLLWLGLLADAFGFEALFYRSWTLREQILKIFESTCGGRVILSINEIGGLKHDIEDSELAGIVETLDAMRPDYEALVHTFLDDASCGERLHGVGVISEKDALNLSMVGPFGRASGVDYDVRMFGDGAYADLAAFEPIVATDGDSDNGDGTLTATHKLEGTTESAGFTNKYHAMPTQVSIGAIKVLEGRELKKDEFSFKLVGEDIESTVTNDADGKINFDKFEYDEPGTYVYTISEVKGDETGMTYDKSVFTATVNVVDDGEGNLKASVAYAKGDKSVEGIVFNNTYKKPETPVPTPDPGTPKTVTNIVKTVKGFLPTTGDQQAAALLMAFVIAMAGVGALVWGIRKR